MKSFQGKLITLTVEQRRLPNGYLARLEIIRHPGAALIIPFLNKDQIILIKQFRPVINSYLYELPAGTLGKNETPLECAKREIIEEIGYMAGKLTKVGSVYPVPGYSTEVITIFKAEQLTRKIRHAEPDEVISIALFRKSQIHRLFKSGKIKDAKTISALAFCDWL